MAPVGRHEKNEQQEKSSSENIAKEYAWTQLLIDYHKIRPFYLHGISLLIWEQIG
jgi:hypothetical protein